MFLLVVRGVLMVSTYSQLIDLRQEIGDCRLCKLCHNRTNLVFGEGSVNARLLLVGEGPGETEDLTGRPFVGKSGELLNEVLGFCALTREDVYIANIVKCRPPKNREPEEDEIEACSRFLNRQITLLRPGCILALGRPASSYLLGHPVRITQERGQVGKLYFDNIPVVPTYHPSYVLRGYNSKGKDYLKSDIQLAWSIANGELADPNARLLEKGVG